MIVNNHNRFVVRFLAFGHGSSVVLDLISMGERKRQVSTLMQNVRGSLAILSTFISSLRIL